MAIFQKLRQAVVDLWQRTEKRDRNRFFVIAGVSLVMIVIAVALLTQTTYVTLVNGGSDFDAAASAKVQAALAEQGIKYKPLANGGLSVPEKDYNMAYGLLATSEFDNVTLDLSIFNQGNSLTSSSASERQSTIYQTARRIEQILGAMDNIQRALVELAIPENKATLYQSQIQEPKASVNVRTVDGSVPDAALAKAIKQQTASAVSGLTPENVTVTCQNGLVVGDLDDTFGVLQDRLDYQMKVSGQMSNNLSALLNASLGAENFRIALNVRLAWDIETVDSLEFEPSVDEEGIVVSMQEMSIVSRNGGAVVGEPGFDENGGGDDYSEITDSDLAYYEQIQNTVNYAVTEIRRHVEKEQGAIADITCSITLNSAIFESNAQYTNYIKSMIGGALGLTAADYDRITVGYDEMRGVQSDTAIKDQYQSELRRQQTMELIRVVVLYLVIGVCMVLLILKTYALFKKTPTEDDLLVDSLTEGFDPELDELQALVEMATLGEIAEAPKSPFREQIEKFIDKNPNAVADLLRNWLNDERY